MSDSSSNFNAAWPPPHFVTPPQNLLNPSPNRCLIQTQCPPNAIFGFADFAFEPPYAYMPLHLARPQPQVRQTLLAPGPPSSNMEKNQVPGRAIPEDQKCKKPRIRLEEVTDVESVTERFCKIAMNHGLTVAITTEQKVSNEVNVSKELVVVKENEKKTDSSGLLESLQGKSEAKAPKESPDVVVSSTDKANEAQSDDLAENVEFLSLTAETSKLNLLNPDIPEFIPCSPSKTENVKASKTIEATWVKCEDTAPKKRALNVPGCVTLKLPPRPALFGTKSSADAQVQTVVSFFESELNETSNNKVQASPPLRETSDATVQSDSSFLSAQEMLDAHVQVSPVPKETSEACIQSDLSWPSVKETSNAEIQTCDTETGPNLCEECKKIIIASDQRSTTQLLKKVTPEHKLKFTARLAARMVRDSPDWLDKPVDLQEVLMEKLFAFCGRMELECDSKEDSLTCQVAIQLLNENSKLASLKKSEEFFQCLKTDVGHQLEIVHSIILDDYMKRKRGSDKEINVNTVETQTVSLVEVEDHECDQSSLVPLTIAPQATSVSVLVVTCQNTTPALSVLNTSVISSVGLCVAPAALDSSPQQPSIVTCVHPSNETSITCAHPSNETSITCVHPSNETCEPLNSIPFSSAGLIPSFQNSFKSFSVLPKKQISGGSFEVQAKSLTNFPSAFGSQSSTTIHDNLCPDHTAPNLSPSPQEKTSLASSATASRKPFDATIKDILNKINNLDYARDSLKPIEKKNQMDAVSSIASTTKLVDPIRGAHSLIMNPPIGVDALRNGSRPSSVMVVPQIIVSASEFDRNSAMGSQGAKVFNPFSVYNGPVNRAALTGLGSNLAPVNVSTNSSNQSSKKSLASTITSNQIQSNTSPETGLSALDQYLFESNSVGSQSDSSCSIFSYADKSVSKSSILSLKKRPRPIDLRRKQTNKPASGAQPLEVIHSSESVYKPKKEIDWWLANMENVNMLNEQSCPAVTVGQKETQISKAMSVTSKGEKTRQNIYLTPMQRKRKSLMSLESKSSTNPGNETNPNSMQVSSSHFVRSVAQSVPSNSYSSSSMLSCAPQSFPGYVHSSIGDQTFVPSRSVYDMATGQPSKTLSLSEKAWSPQKLFGDTYSTIYQTSISKTSLSNDKAWVSQSLTGNAYSSSAGQNSIPSLINLSIQPQVPSLLNLSSQTSIPSLLNTSSQTSIPSLLNSSSVTHGTASVQASKPLSLKEKAWLPHSLSSNLNSYEQSGNPSSLVGNAESSASKDCSAAVVGKLAKTQNQKTNVFAERYQLPTSWSNLFTTPTNSAGANPISDSFSNLATQSEQYDLSVPHSLSEKPETCQKSTDKVLYYDSLDTFSDSLVQCRDFERAIKCPNVFAIDSLSDFPSCNRNQYQANSVAELEDKEIKDPIPWKSGKSDTERTSCYGLDEISLTDEKGVLRSQKLACEEETWIKVSGQKEDSVDDQLIDFRLQEKYSNLIKVILGAHEGLTREEAKTALELVYINTDFLKGMRQPQILEQVSIALQELYPEKMKENANTKEDKEMMQRFTTVKTNLDSAKPPTGKAKSVKKVKRAKLSEGAGGKCDTQGSKESRRDSNDSRCDGSAAEESSSKGEGRDEPTRNKEPEVNMSSSFSSDTDSESVNSTERNLSELD
uniref:Uncharacterized protein n=1 Tax=Biomphalaria glabrata TaxID=6526 RepID=A0A2C9KDG9_BIOGL